MVRADATLFLFPRGLGTCIGITISGSNVKGRGGAGFFTAFHSNVCCRLSKLTVVDVGRSFVTWTGFEPTKLVGRMCAICSMDHVAVGA